MILTSPTPKPSDPYFYDPAAAEHAVEFFERYLRHHKGKWAGHPFRLLDWQKRDIIRPLFGWRRSDGTRMYRTAYVEIPRKNGKSTLAAGIALDLLTADSEWGAEVYSAAADKEQARLVFDTAKAMRGASPALRKRTEEFRSAITYPKLGGTYKVISADAPTKHGVNAHGIVFDELHAQRNRDLWDVLTTSTGSREQPLTFVITTAGFDRKSICWEQHEYAEKVAKGIIEDYSTFVYIAFAPFDADWTDEATWRDANPSLGVTISLDYLRRECKKAQHTPAYQNTFRRLHLNQWTQAETRAIDLRAWDATAGLVDPLALKGHTCYGGLDLASTTDLAAFVLVFPDDATPRGYDVLPHFFIPADNIEERERRDKVPYSAWAREGLLTATPGNVIDFEFIEKVAERASHAYRIREVAYDPFNAAYIAQRLQDKYRLRVVPISQTFAKMSPPTKELLTLVASARIRHGGHPVLRWNADNLVVREDASGYIRPDRERSTEKIDGIVALIMGLGRAALVKERSQWRVIA